MRRLPALIPLLQMALVGAACAPEEPQHAEPAFREVELVAPAGSSVTLNVPSDFFDWRNPALSSRQNEAGPIPLNSITFHYDAAKLATYAEECKGTPNLEYPVLWAISGSQPGYFERALATAKALQYAETGEVLHGFQILSLPQPSRGIYRQNITLVRTLPELNIIGTCYINKSYDDFHISQRCFINSEYYINETMSISSQVLMPFAYVEHIPQMMQCVFAITNKWMLTP